MGVPVSKDISNLPGDDDIDGQIHNGFFNRCSNLPDFINPYYYINGQVTKCPNRRRSSSGGSEINSTVSDKNYCERDRGVTTPPAETQNTSITENSISSTPRMDYKETDPTSNSTDCRQPLNSKKNVSFSAGNLLFQNGAGTRPRGKMFISDPRQSNARYTLSTLETREYAEESASYRRTSTPSTRKL